MNDGTPGDTLGLDPEGAQGAPWSSPVSPGRRLVDVAVDVPGVAGGVLYSWHLPPSLMDLGVGEAVLVEYGRRQAVGVVLRAASTDEVPARPTKPVLARVRSDGPLLTPLQARLAIHVCEHYLAPATMVVRQMLPPGELERIELVALSPAVCDDEAFDPTRGVPGRPLTAADQVLLAALRAADGVSPVDELPQERNRATTLRRLRALAEDGHVRLEWRVRPSGVAPRSERRVLLTDAGAAAAAQLALGERPDAPGGARLGPRQLALMLELADGLPEDGVVAARLAERHGASAVTSLARRGWLELVVGTHERRPLAGRGPGARGARPSGTSLTPDQARVVERMVAASLARHADPVLLEGVVASGKTAVYAAAIDASLDAGRDAIVLVPEASLALPLVDRLRHDLGVEPVLVHSGLSVGERADEWRRLRSATTPQVVVGTRLAILAPVRDPGIVVVDEEHDPAYKSDRTPRFQARDVALELGRLAGAPVLLGSATPDIVSIGRARQGSLAHLRLADRAAGAAPSIEVVDLRAELAEGNRGLLSAPLVAALRTLDTKGGEQAILVINRRGSASVVLCRDCGYVQICPECQRPLVFHAAQMALRCHHCGATAPPARRCPACGSPRIRYLGGGTERVEHEVRARFPELRVSRLDRDVAERRGAAAAVIDDLVAGHTDVLVGTSLVTKGLDVPQVTLVGVVSADVALTLPDERAAERTWQLLAQAAGRAGRGDQPGRAIIQTYLPEHPAIRAVADGDPRTFVEAELEQRRRFGSPPFGRLVKLTVALPEHDQALAEARRFTAELRARAAAEGGPPSVTVLGPVPAYVARRAGRWQFHVVLRGPHPIGLLGGDPGAPWSVDVDPESLL